jgi:hypothetical protein
MRGEKKRIGDMREEKKKGEREQKGEKREEKI